MPLKFKQIKTTKRGKKGPSGGASDAASVFSEAPKLARKSAMLPEGAQGQACAPPQTEIDVSVENSLLEERKSIIGEALKESIKSQMGYSQNKFQEIRDKTATRDNWNYYVGDADNKTDILLRFYSKATKIQYMKHLISTSKSQLNIIMAVLGLVNVYLRLTQGQTSSKSMLLQLGVTIVSVMATFTWLQRKVNFDFVVIQGLVNLVPFLLSLQTLHLYDRHLQKDEEALLGLSVLVLHILPSLLVNMLVMADSLEYLAASILTLMFHVFFCTLENVTIRGYVWTYLQVVAVSLLVFVSNERQRKEFFIVSLTNAKCKKQLMKMFNTQSPVLIISKDGTIQMTNTRFDKMIKDQLQIKTMPQNFLKFMKNDKLEESLKKIWHQSGQFLNEPSEDFEITIRRSELQKEPPKKMGRKSHSVEVYGQLPKEEPKEEDFDNQLFSDVYESYKVSITIVQYKALKCVRVSLESLTDVKAQQRLLYMHSKLINQFITNTSKRMENLHRQLMAKNQTDLSTQIGEYLGNQQVTLNMIQQITHYFKYVSNLNDYKVDNYALNEEIDYCIDGLTANKWEKEIAVYLTKGKMPTKVVGDLTRFRICMRTLLEFGIRYSCDNQMSIKCEFLNFNDERQFVIQFSLILTKSETYSLDPLEILFAEQENENEELTFEKEIAKYYKQFFDHVKDFGFGMIVLPSLVKQLKGAYFIETFTPNEASSDGQSSKKVQLRIGFKLPFEPAGGDNSHSTSTYKINSFRKEIDGKLVFQTPQLKANCRSIDISRMQNMQNMMAGQGLSSYVSNRQGSQDTQNQGGGHAAPSPAHNSGSTQNNNYNSNAAGFASMVGASGNQPASLALGKNVQGAISSDNLIFSHNSATASAARNSLKNAADNNLMSNFRSVEPKRHGTNPLNNNSGENFTNEQSQNVSSSIATNRYTSVAANMMGVNSVPQPAISAIDNTQKNLREQLLLNSSNEINLDSKKNNNQKSKANNIKSSLLGLSIQEGKPKSFFQEPKKASEFQSQQSSANFASFKPHNNLGHPLEEEKQGGQPDSYNKAFSFMDANRAVSSSATSIKIVNSSQQIPTNQQNPPVESHKGDPGVVQSRGSGSVQNLRQYVKKQKQVLDVSTRDEFGAGIRIPESVKVDVEELDDSENKDQVRSLQRNDDLLSDDAQPFNFQMEKIDSFMISSDSMGLTITSSKGQRDPSEIVHQIGRSGIGEEKSKPLSHMVRRQIFNNFSEIKGATKNLYESPVIPAPVAEVPKVKLEKKKEREEEKEESQIQIRPQSVQKEQEEIKNDGVPNIFMSRRKQRVYMDNPQEIKTKTDDKFIKYADQVSKQWPSIRKKIKQNVNGNVLELQKNLLIHPQHLNDEFDCMDRNRNLENFKQVMLSLEMDDREHSSVSDRSVMQQDQKQSQKLQASSKSLLNDDDQKLGKQIILIVEDDEFIQASLQLQVKKIGVEYEAALNGQLGVEMVEKYLQEGKMFDIILMDLVMPILNGFQASKAIRDLEKKYGVSSANRHFICGHSSHVSQGVERKCYQSHMDDIAAKPIKIQALERMLSLHDRRKSVASKLHQASPSQLASDSVSPVGMSTPLLLKLDQKNENYSTNNQVSKSPDEEPHFLNQSNKAECTTPQPIIQNKF